MTKETGGHPDLLQLDAFRAGEADAGVSEHVASCSRCRDIVEGMSEQASALREAHETVSQPPGDLEERILAAALGVAAAALILVLNFLVHTPPADKTASVLAPEAVTRTGDESATPTRPAGDVNGDGVFDGDDVIELERRVLAGGEGLEAWNLNGDGITDEFDVDVLAGEIDIPAPDSEGEEYFSC
jgi:hypothetical protein